MTASLTTAPATPVDTPPAANPTIPVRRPMTLRVAPRREPPFDDEIAAVGGEPRLRLANFSEQPLPFDVVRPSAVAVAVLLGEPKSGRSSTLVDPSSWGRRLFVALLEARAGLRPVRQLANYFSPPVHAGLTAQLSRVPITPNGKRPATVKSVHVCEPADGVAEVCAVIFTGARYRAIAARLEEYDGRWRCVHLQLG
jgi:hypothetical protein